MARTIMMFAGLAVSSALMVATTPMARTLSRASVNTVVMAADIVTTAASLQGPVLFWGAEGVAKGHDESDIKGYDNFGKFVAAVQAAGLADTLRGPGPFTVLAPTDAAFDEYKGQITPEILKYHVISGKVPTSSITGDLDTLSGKKLSYRRYVRKTFLDNAMIGITSAGASKGQTYPCDVECSNGLIHAIDMVLVPGEYSPGTV